MREMEDAFNNIEIEDIKTRHASMHIGLLHLKDFVDNLLSMSKVIEDTLSLEEKNPKNTPIKVIVREKALEYQIDLHKEIQELENISKDILVHTLANSLHLHHANGADMSGKAVEEFMKDINYQNADSTLVEFENFDSEIHDYYLEEEDVSEEEPKLFQIDLSDFWDIL